MLDTLDFMDTLSYRFLSSGLMSSALMYRDDPIARIRSYGSILVGVTVSYIVAILLFFSLVYRPAIMQMDKDMRRTRAMLLVFPDEVQSLAYG